MINHGEFSQEETGDTGRPDSWHRLAAKTPSSTNHSPTRFLVITTVSIFVAEAAIMAFLSLLPPLSVWTEVFLDASLIAVLVFPLLYIWLFGPLTKEITERRELENVLRESEERFREYISHAPDAIFVTDSEGHFLEVNKSAAAISGHSRAELLTMSLSDLVTWGQLEDFPEMFEELKNRKQISAEVEMQRHDAWVIWVSFDAVSLSRERALIFCSDITEKKRLQQMESRAERLETAGRIAGQVAHDFNNLLAPLMAYPDFIREELPENHPALPFLIQIENSTRRIVDINQQLLALGRRGHYNMEPVNLNDVILEVLIEHKPFPDSLNCKTEFDWELRMIKGGGSQLHRVISNLLQNAREAMFDTGNLEIKTEHWYVDGTSVAFNQIPKGEYARVTITDTGCGIEADKIEKIFDPFVTSKTSDKIRGSGLGLSVVDSIVRDHGAFIDISSRVGEGTTFHLYFPVTNERAMVPHASSIAGGSERVLVIEDDDILRDLSERMLRPLGYEVSSISSGEEAVEFVKDNPQDLLVLDMMMPPGIDGAETYQRILQLYPTQRAIIASGYSDSDRVRLAQDLGAGAFIKKPFTKKVLAAAIREELDRAERVPVG